MKKKYIVAKNPDNKLWYCCGLVFDNKYMPVSHGFSTKKEADNYANSQPKIDKMTKMLGCQNI